MTTKMRILAALLAAPAALAIAAPAHAQVSGIATANLSAVVYKSKAFTGARQQISTTYKASFDQREARIAALQKELEPMQAQLLAQFDTNKDGKLNQAEQAALQASKSPTLDKFKAAQDAAEADVARLTNPAARAQLFAIEGILRQYDAAQLRVVTAKKVNVVLSPEVFLYAPDSADITDAIVADLDKNAPTVSIQPPADWQPSRETVNLQQQLAQIDQMLAYQAAAQRAQQGQAGAAPAAAGTRPAAPAPTAPKPGAKPAEPR
ncbi:OmpH family outer membrane protein [Sphingomonas sp. JC676]|uniref:OmpH family outer membrane protein n=1 Tax=Sphingomonas sp. JC676 TaxID=2768065 RepID=UPI001657BEEB|nr:OmpH family outer membrane protein [Sphingomonas sp. JC676]MBC9031760.1 OmpH family outer membrane protein [Sphingomonas sp. JC676]